jgi:hypothetical protein
MTGFWPDYGQHLDRNTQLLNENGVVLDWVLLFWISSKDTTGWIVLRTKDEVYYKPNRMKFITQQDAFITDTTGWSVLKTQQDELCWKHKMKCITDTTGWSVLKTQKDEFIKDATGWIVWKTQQDELY